MILKTSNCFEESFLS